MEAFLRVEAEAKYWLGNTDRAYEQELLNELLKIVEEAELLFGPRNRSYELLAPRITECGYGHPFIYPFRKIRIYLTSHSKNRQAALYQLSHEAIHILSPTRISATVLEEGLATYFSHQYMRRVYGLNFEVPNQRYGAAMRAVSRLLAKNELLISELRVREPYISKIEEKLLVEVGGCEPELAKFLSADFQTYGRKPSPVSEQAAQSAQLFAIGWREIWDQWKSA